MRNKINNLKFHDEASWPCLTEKCNKYELVIFYEKLRFAFANCLQILIQVPFLTHSAMIGPGSGENLWNQVQMQATAGGLKHIHW